MYQCRSGPRYLVDYNAQQCTEDCQCWHNEPGCGDNDALCNDDMRCVNNVCVLTNNDQSPKKLLRKNMKEIEGAKSFFVPGVMFDIQARANPLKIINLYYQGIKSNVLVDIYTKEWTHFKWSENEAKWTFLGSAYLQRAPDDTPKLFPSNIFEPIFLEKWNRRGFYIQTRNCGTDCNKLRVWLGDHYAETSNPFMENSDARLLEGCALKGRFDNSGGRCRNNEKGGESFTFWGGVRYVVRDI